MRSSVAANVLRHGLVSYWPIVTTQGGLVLPDLVSGLDLYVGSGASIGMSCGGGSACHILHSRARAEGNHAALDTHPRFQLTTPMSLSIWTVSYAAPTHDVGLLAHWSGVGGFMLYYTGSTFRIYFDGVNVVLDAGVAADSGRWYHLVGTWDGAAVRIFIDGLEKASSAHSSLTAISSNALMINAYNNNNDRGWDDGAYKHAALWNRCLTPTEVRALHADEEIMLRTFPLLPVNKPAAASGALLRRLHTEGLFVGSTC